jgi:hypothetical protein
MLAIVGGFLSPRVASWLESRDIDEMQVVSTQAVDDPVGATSPPEVQAPIAAVDSEPQPDVDPADGNESAASEAAAESSPAEAGAVDETATPVEPEPTPVPEPEPQPARLAAARSIEDIEVASGPSGTVVTIRADGSLGDGVLSVEPLSSPPRLLVRLRGIESGYRPYLIEVGSPEVTTIRMGHHAERRPPEIWVVIDLVGDGLGVEGIDIRGDVAELVVADR